MKKEFLVLASLALGACGGGGDSGGSGSSGGSDNSTPVGSLSLLTGRMGGAGNTDGTGSAARFSSPVTMARDSAGNFFITDCGNNTIRKMTPQGVVTTFAGQSGRQGTRDQIGRDARFSCPAGIAIDTRGTAETDDDIIYVADSDNHSIRKILADGTVTTLAGEAGISGATDGTGAAAHFAFPYGLVLGAGGNLYVADRDNHAIRKVTPTGDVTTYAGKLAEGDAVDDVNLTVARFKYPRGLAMSATGVLYVSDAGNYTIRAIGTGGVSTIAGAAGQAGYTNANGAAARFNAPAGLALDGSGNIYVAEEVDGAIRLIQPNGDVSTFAGQPGQPLGVADGPVATATLTQPSGVLVDSNGDVLVVDKLAHNIRRVAGGAVSTVAGLGRPALATAVDGSFASAGFRLPAGVVADNTGAVQVADTGTHTIRNLFSNVVSTLAGTLGVSGTTNDTGAAARFTGPQGLAYDSASNLYASEDAHTIRRIAPGAVVTAFAGVANSSGSVDTVRFVPAKPEVPADPVAGTPLIPAVPAVPAVNALFKSPKGLAIDRSGLVGGVLAASVAAQKDNVFVADYGNGTIRRIKTDGFVSTFLGKAGTPGTDEGDEDTARFRSPYGVVIDKDGNLYVSDTAANTIRKVTKTVKAVDNNNDGVTDSEEVTYETSTLAGSPDNFGNADGKGAEAKFNGPMGLTIDSSGYLYVADYYNNAVRRISPEGVVTTLAKSSVLNFPRGVQLYNGGLLITTDNAVVAWKP